MKQRLVRAIMPFGSTRRVLRGPARGMRFVVEPGIGLTYALGTESAAPRHFAEHIRPGMTVYDVGANKGQMALLYAALVGATGRVVSFEPSPPEFASLDANVRLNALAHVRLVQAAAAEAEGNLMFTYAADRPTQGKLASVEPTYENAGAESFSVRTVALDSLLDCEPFPDVIKIDVEGAAASVLRGASRILDEASPRLYIELHGPEEQAGVRDELLARGYVAETMAGEVVPDPTDGWQSPLWVHRPESRRP